MSERYDEGMSVERREVPGGMRCRVAGELTMATRDELAACIIELFDDGHVVVELDLSDVGFMDSQGLWALMRARQHAEQTAAGELRVVDASPPVRQLLQVTTLDTLLGYRPES